MPLEMQSLIQPVAPESPCGVDPDGSQLLSELDGYALWGRLVPPDKSNEKEKDIDWRAIRDKALAALERSRDLRLLAYLAAAVVRLDGLFAFSQVLQVASHWLPAYWDQVFPLVDEDAVLRKNALNLFADRIAVVDAVRRAPVIVHRQLGS